MIGKPLVEDSDVIFREYVHHALTEAVPGGLAALSGFQLSGLESGLADYYPCSFSNRPVFGAKAAQVLRDLFGAAAFPNNYIRNLTSDLGFGQLSATDQHVPTQAGAVWGPAFWQVRDLLGKDTADKLLFDSWISLQAAEIKADDPSFFVQKLVELDQARRGGQDIAQIKLLLQKRRLPLAKVRW